MDTTTVYAEIVKHERDENGDLIVYGRATGPDLDLDQQICDPEWLKTAMPKWFEIGNVREQHSAIAAGVGTELTAAPDGGWDLKSLVVDQNSARKVEKGVLKGYSIGISRPKVVRDKAAPGGRITSGDIVEVSLVDRPANPSCQLRVAKTAKPGMSIAAGDLDTEHMLVKVEEWSDRRGEPAAALAQLAIVKADGETADIGNAQQAIAIIARLIQSEADGLAAGEMNEACDIDLLLQAIDALRWFQQRESQEEAPVATTIDMAATPAATTTAADAGKAAPEGAPVVAPVVETPAPDDAEKAVEGEEKNDLTELVKALNTQVTELQTQVTKAMSAPAPGGPVLTRTTEDTAKAAGREHVLAKAAEYERTAYGLNGPDRDAYLQLAAETRAAAPTS